MTGSENKSGSLFLRLKLKNALSNSNEIISEISSNISSKLNLISNSVTSVLNLSSTQNINKENENRRDSKSEEPLPLHMLPGTPEPMISPLNNTNPSTTVNKIKESLKLGNLRPAIEEFMLSDETSEPTTLPTDTPESPKSGLRYKISSAINNSTIPKKLEDYKALAIRTLSGDGMDQQNEKNMTSILTQSNLFGMQNVQADVVKVTVSSTGCDENSSSANDSLNVGTTSLSDADRRSKICESASSGASSDNGVGHSVDSNDSDPHRKLWIRSSSQLSLQSWASSLSYDSHCEDVNETRDFMKTFVNDIFKNTFTITSDRKAEFDQFAKTEQGRLWFARCINAKRGCRKVSEEAFCSLIEHFSVMLLECSQADDFAPAKSLMNMCFTYYHEVPSPTSCSGMKNEYLYCYVRDQEIWRSSRFWNAAFFDALQCERFLRPIATREQKCDRNDDIQFQQNISFGQLGTFTCNMHAFGLPKMMVSEFLRKQTTIGCLRTEQTDLLRGNVDRLFSAGRSN